MPPKKAAGPASKKSTTSKPAANGVTKSQATKKAPDEAPAQSITKAEAKAPAKRSSKPTAKAATKAPAKTAASTKVAANTGKKRKAADDEPEEQPRINGVKRARTATKSATPAPPATKRKAAAKKAPTKAKTILTRAPTDRLDIYVFGNGEQSELGLGPEKKAREVKRPRLNPFLDADKVGVVAMSVGGMHTAVLTHDNRIMTWGVNDQGALGRDTEWDGGVRDISDEKSDSGSDSSDEEDDEALNPRECTPTEIDVSSLPENIIWTQLACTDSATFALTDEGLVYGWGTFRVSCPVPRLWI